MNLLAVRGRQDRNSISRPDGRLLRSDASKFWHRDLEIVCLPLKNTAAPMSDNLADNRHAETQNEPGPVTEFPTVAVGPFEVAALSQAEVVRRIAHWPDEQRPAVFNHLHVGALNFRDDPTFAEAMADAEMVYADGMATVLVGKLSGAEGLERSGLTDIGHEILEALNTRLARPARIAFLGGADDLAERAGNVLASQHGIEVVIAEHGYRTDDEWSELLVKVAEAKPDAMFVGLGMPREAIWAMNHRHELPDCLVLCAGGFFGHVVGDEKRAPEWAQKEIGRAHV